MAPTVFVLDVDGVMTTGRFFYSAEGKVMKEFGPHDNDGIKMLKDLIEIRFITADKRGFPISKKRIDDMHMPLDLVREPEREAFFENLGYENVIFIGDAMHDAPVLKKCAFGIAPANARKEAREAADYVTESNAGDGAVLDACLEIKRKFFP